jgi:uncharacterized protein (DUF2132 family)
MLQTSHVFCHSSYVLQDTLRSVQTNCASKPNAASTWLLLHKEVSWPRTKFQNVYITCTKNLNNFCTERGNWNSRNGISQHEPLHHIAHLAHKLIAEWTECFSARSQFIHHWFYRKIKSFQKKPNLSMSKHPMKRRHSRSQTRWTFYVVRATSTNLCLHVDNMKFSTQNNEFVSVLIIIRTILHVCLSVHHVQ